MHHEPGSEKLTRSRTSALIIAPSAQIRDSLLVLLRAIPQIEAIHQADDAPAALALMREVQPALVLLDYDLFDGALQTTLSQIKADRPQTQFVVLLDDEQDRRRVENAGTDVILIKGIRAATVLETIEGLLSEGRDRVGKRS
jgi:DNA-binding NarL/FixJ family response regulator